VEYDLFFSTIRAPYVRFKESIEKYVGGIYKSEIEIEIEV